MQKAALTLIIMFFSITNVFAYDEETSNRACRTDYVIKLLNLERYLKSYKTTLNATFSGSTSCEIWFKQTGCIKEFDNRLNNLAAILPAAEASKIFISDKSFGIGKLAIIGTDLWNMNLSYKIKDDNISGIDGRVTQVQGKDYDINSLDDIKKEVEYLSYVCKINQLDDAKFESEIRTLIRKSSGK